MPTATEQPPKVSQASLLAATWSLFAIAVLFFLARIAIRLKISRRLYFDDAWASLALLILLGLALVLTVAIPSMYQVLNVGAGLAEPDTDFMKNATFYLKLQFALTYLYWSCLWAVKACFLSFYHRLTKNLKYCRQVWWATVIISVLSYIGAIITRRKMNSSDDEMSPKGPRLSTHPTAIQLDERSREIAVHQNGTIELAGRGDSTERILRGYEVT
ncbi:hypothetical protein HO133_005105 [Letharia lupina]|uniref:Rhodopsin domain-containing protein n=1 Tax=Letharia lupina TaxID=560253 RepID=A0A8H6C9B6_9LECA|nr:uncharacterized protein HO133_005105 [Letharia lupina]KAF6219280.1 hypothetical protein HO133_005105 [Letharia lupina]